MVMLIAMSGCKNKVKNVTVNVYGPGQNDPDVFNVSSEAQTIKDVLDKMSTPTTFECTYEEGDNGLKITAIRAMSNIYDKEGSTIEVTRNGNPLSGGIDKEAVEDGDVIDIRYSEPEEKPQETLFGGWQLCDQFNVVLSEEEREIFAKATQDMLSVKYEPIRVIATQVVNGTNYAYLVSQEKVVEKPVKEFYIVKIYKNLEDRIEFQAINKLAPTDIVAVEKPEEVAGGWEVGDPDNSGIFLDVNAQTSFTKAAGSYVGANLQPVQLLASQVVNGTNYIALCKGQSVTDKPLNAIYIVNWHAPLEGEPTINEVKVLDLNYYTYGE